MLRARSLRLWSFWVPFSVALGIMLSPENLVILGQQTGASGGAVFFGLAAAAGIHLFTARTYGSGSTVAAHPREPGQLPKAFRTPLAVALSLAARGGFALWGVTAMLVTAGYVFNETFWPAYPNLGFSFTLLALLLVLNLPGTGVAAVSQIVFVAAALAGLAVLIVMGLLGSPGALAQSRDAGVTAWGKGLFLAPIFLFPFIGYELSRFLREQKGKNDDQRAGPMLAGITAAFCLFSLWCLISLRYVPGLKLQESTVPYAYVARAVAGESGILIMGMVLLAGTLAAANALLLAVPLMASGLPPVGLLPVILRGRVLTLLLLTGGVALVMALGLGGSPNLPCFLKASALFWLLTYAWRHLAAWRGRGGERITAVPAVLAGLCALALMAAVVLALATDPTRAVLGIYMLLVAGVLALLGAIPWGTKRKFSGGLPKKVS